MHRHTTASGEQPLAKRRGTRRYLALWTRCAFSLVSEKLIALVCFEMPFSVSASGTELDVSTEVIDRKERLARVPTRRGVTKPKGSQARHSVTDVMETDAEKLLSAVERGLFKFEDILPMTGMPIGGIGIGPGTDGEKGEKAFWAYIKQPTVVTRLVSEGFQRSGGGAPHPWHLVKGVGVVSPTDTVLCRSLTPEQRKKIEVNRLNAIARKNRGPRGL